MSSREEALLNRAIEKGLLSTDQLSVLENEAHPEMDTLPLSRWSSRIQMLITKGVLEETVVQELDREVSGSDETQADWTQPESTRPPQAISVPERYQRLEYLGEGGMARVYRAHDTMLHRTVALKFLRSDDASMAQRLLAEARLQARIEHENVCKVYEVGESGGQPYIAMQYIRGNTLKDLIKRLRLEQKIEIMKDVAQAVHTAHRVGLIHRDLKPSNILVEHTEEGEWIPYVMDFGLAREAEVDGMTQTGMMVGTPSYMSPEQARGESRKLDRRSDVFSLGATLYELLSDRLPFEGASTVEVLMKIVHEDPVLLRQRDSGIPHDLETIVMKCLEKSPASRYDSARVLAEELGRYLEGEPVLAKPTGWANRLYKRAIKHKTLTGTILVAILIVILLAGIALRTEWKSKAKADLAQHFGREVERMQSTMREVYLLPLHDTRREKLAVLDRMTQIKNIALKVGSIGYGPGELALGGGYLSLHDYRNARIHLENAWHDGFTEPQVAYSLGQTMGHLYQEELQELQQITNKQAREARRAAIEKEFRDPAMQYLTKGGSVENQDPEYAEALLAFYDQKYEEALKKASVAAANLPGLYQAKKLVADIYVKTAKEKRDAGHIEEAMQDYSRADKAYSEAIEIGRSDSENYLGMAGLWNGMLTMAVWHGASPDEARSKVLQACAQTLVADPENADAYDYKTYAHSLYGYYLFDKGKDPTAELALAIDSGNRALRINPGYSDVYSNLGIAYQQKADYLASRGIDPHPALESAISSLEKAIQLNPNVQYPYSNLGNALWSLGDSQRDTGKDPKDSYNRAVKTYEKSLALEVDQFGYMNLSGVLISMGNYETTHGISPAETFRKALHTVDEALKINAQYPLVYNRFADAYILMADFKAGQGVDPTAELENARANLKKSLEFDPEAIPAVSSQASTEIIAAKFEVSRQRSPEVFCERAQESIQRLKKLQPDVPDIYKLQGQLELIRARWLLAQNQSPEEALRRAEKSLRETARLNQRDANSRRDLALVSLLRSRWKVRQKVRPETEIQEGLKQVDEALSVNPQLAEAHAIRGALLLVAGQQDKAIEALNRALSINANLKHEYGPLLR